MYVVWLTRLRELHIAMESYGSPDGFTMDLYVNFPTPCRHEVNLDLHAIYAGTHGALTHDMRFVELHVRMPNPTIATIGS
jgi:hypothetical protein